MAFYRLARILAISIERASISGRNEQVNVMDKQRVKGLGFRVYRFKGFGYRIKGLEFRFRVYLGLGFAVVWSKKNTSTN